MHASTSGGAAATGGTGTPGGAATDQHPHAHPHVSVGSPTEAGSVASTASSTAGLPLLKTAAASTCARLGLRAKRWCWEVGVLSRRNLLDLVRNPVLFLSHLGAASYFASTFLSSCVRACVMAIAAVLGPLVYNHN